MKRKATVLGAIKSYLTIDNPDWKVRRRLVIFVTVAAVFLMWATIRWHFVQNPSEAASVIDHLVTLVKVTLGAFITLAVVDDRLKHYLDFLKDKAPANGDDAKQEDAK